MKTNKDEKRKYLESKGWMAWYHPNYWVHTKLVSSKETDHTKYGMSLDEAYEYEKELSLKKKLIN